MKMRAAIFCTMLLFVLTANSQVIFPSARLAIHGQVTDATGTPMAGVEILVTYAETKRIPRAAATDEAGTYSVSGLAAGRFVVTANLAGLREDRKTLIIADARTNTADFTMTVLPIGDCPGINCETAPRSNLVEAERVLAQTWNLSMQRAGAFVNPGNATSRTEELRRQEVTRRLRALGKEAIPALILALKDPDIQMRRNGALVLADFAMGLTVEARPRLDIQEAVPDLTVALDDPDDLVRRFARIAINKMEHN